MRFYITKDGEDYLCIDETIQLGNPSMYEGRAPSISGIISSVEGALIHKEYIKRKCKAVKREDVPAYWLKALTGAS